MVNGPKGPESSKRLQRKVKPERQLLADIRTGAFEQFGTILKKYRGQRPKRE